ncbi:MAG: PilT/PilU family type 4a pilus ATPase [Immundisolibacter sp.]|uniref:PilT/PilU family type 4a pilus ATPase n=1 Tax=Immundisolibacter sp. TaxID=1934948 RepID=UPI003D0EA345
MDFASLLQTMVEQNSSDLFVTAGVAPSIKTHGAVKPVTDQKFSSEEAREMCYGVMNERQRTQLENTMECNFAISARGIGRFRVSTFIQRGNVGMVVRKIETHIPTIEDLQVPPVLKDIALIERGLALMVGGTGTGKSTTLAAMVGYRNHNSTGHIITIEDPVEYLHDHGGCIVTQREVGVDTMSFEEALKNTLRQAPDVILIGEIRSRETMEHAIAFAETGHLCLATLHANNANQALDRIINFFPEERRGQLLMDLSLNLKAIVSQRLLPTVDGKGRRAAVEVMLASPLISELIRKGAVHEIKPIMARSNELGMRTFDQALHALYAEGSITYEDAIANADSANDLRLLIKLEKDGSAAKLAQDAQKFALKELPKEEPAPIVFSRPLSMAPRQGEG